MASPNYRQLDFLELSIRADKQLSARPALTPMGRPVSSETSLNARSVVSDYRVLNIKDAAL